MGWSAPGSALEYWARGIPVPNIPFDANVNASGQPHILRQLGWSIVFDRYQSNLPTRIAMESNGIRLKIIIQQWELPDAADPA
jgi:outer membrane lipoprotein LolB